MQQKHSLFFQYTCQFLKYFLLFTVGWVTACLIAGILGASGLVAVLLGLMKLGWGRLALCALLTLACAIIFESMQ